MRHAFSVTLIALILLAHSASGADPAPITKTTVSEQIPAEVVDGNNIPVPGKASVFPIVFFDDFSWRSFIALMWPAKAGERGVPDTSRTIGEVTGPRVWETWKAAYETVPSKGSIPGDWGSFDGETPCAQIANAGSGNARVFASFTRFGDISEADFGTLAGPVVSQNSRYVHYEIKVNKEEYEFIRSKKLYDRSVIDGLTSPLSFTNGSIEIKAAWREFSADEPESIRSRYYRTQAFVKNYQTQLCDKRELGLIGFHIVQKTPLRPQWVWSSFEHVDNVPAIGQSLVGVGKFSLNDPTKPQALDPAIAPNAVDENTYLNSVGAPFLPPFQVIRQLPIHFQTTDRNTRYQSALKGTVWANYMLVVTQWPTDPAVSAKGAPFPTKRDGLSMSNTTMETYFQNSSSCMSCHDDARSSHMDFVFFPIIHAATRDPGGPPDSRSNKLIKTLDVNFNNLRKESSKIESARLGDK